MRASKCTRAVLSSSPTAASARSRIARWWASPLDTSQTSRPPYPQGGSREQVGQAEVVRQVGGIQKRPLRRGCVPGTSLCVTQRQQQPAARLGSGDQRQRHRVQADRLLIGSLRSRLVARAPGVLHGLGRHGGGIGGEQMVCQLGEIGLGCPPA